MKKIILAICIVCICTWQTKAQNATTGATQKANLELSNALDIAIVGGATNVNIQFNSLNDLLNGVETATHELKVRSNRQFRVSVKPSSNSFTYAGSDLLGSLLQVSSVMKIMVVDNNTGGYRPWLAYFTGWQSFLLNSSVTLLTDCRPGDNQTFTVKYKATPGIGIVAGTYTTDMVYTATQE